MKLKNMSNTVTVLSKRFLAHVAYLVVSTLHIPCCQHTSHTLLSAHVAYLLSAHVAYFVVSQTLFLLTNSVTALQMFNDIFGRRFTIRCRANIHLSWCIKRNWLQNIVGSMTFWSFMLIPVWRTRKYFFCYSHFAIYNDNQLATRKNSRHWFAKSNGNERQINTMKDHLFCSRIFLLIDN